MKIVEPKVFLIGYTVTDDDAINEWLESVNGRAVLDHISGSDAEQLVELGGRLCYRSFDVGLNPNVTKVHKDSGAYHANILKSKHGSVLEHASSTWILANISRVATHELVRHRQGVAYSQESLRYVRLTDLGFWFPPEIAKKEGARALFEEIIEKVEEAQKRLAAIFGIDKIKNFAEKKKLTSAFRRIAPIGLATNIMFTANMRALRWVIEMRTSAAAEIEIRKVFCQVFDIASKRWPFFFQDFERIDTGDGLFEAKPSNSKV